MKEFVLYKTPCGFGIPEELMRIVYNKGGFLDESDGAAKQMADSVMFGFQERLGFLQQQSQKKMDVVTVVEFIRGDTIDAFSYTSPDPNFKFDFIGINIGVVASAWDVCWRLMSLPSFLPEIGDSSLENAERTFEQYWHSSAVKGGRKPCLPRCPVRYCYARSLAEHMMGFIFFHEAGHLQNGHVEFNRKLNELTHMSESDPLGAFAKRPEIKQVIEMDADAAAVNLSLAFCALQRDFIRQKPSPDARSAEAHHALVGTSENIARTCILASSLFFRLYGDMWLKWDPHTQAEHTHPMLPVREHMVHITLMRIMHEGKIWGVNQYDIASLSLELSLSIESSLAIIEQREVDNEAYKSVVTAPQIRKYLKSLKSAWTEIRPFLAPNVRRGTLAPAEDW